MVVLGENKGIVVEGSFFILKFFYSNFDFKVPNYIEGATFWINKVKYRSKYLFTPCLLGTNMDVSSPKGLNYLHTQMDSLLFGHFVKREIFYNICIFFG